MVYLVLLGVAQDAGVPQTGCACANCTAVWTGALARQWAVSAALVDPGSSSCWLVDCTPDFKEQYHLLQEWLAPKGLQDCTLKGALLTHLHMGHYLGLVQFGREAMDWKGLQVHGTQSVLDFLQANQPWKQYLQGGNFTLMPALEPGQVLQLSPALSVTPAAVPHRAEFSDAVGYYIQGPSRKALYLPDIDSWDQWAAQGTDIRQVVSSVDLAFLDACFYDATELPGRDMSKVPHPLVVDTMQRLQGLAAGTRVVLVHLNHTSPLWRAGAQRATVQQAGLHVGQQGAVYELMATGALETGHLDMVHDAQLDYYGKRLATCSSDRTVKVFDLSGDQKTLIADLRGHEGPIWQVSWAHPRYGSLLASASFDHRVIIWKEGADGQWMQVYKTPSALHSASVNSIAFGPQELGLVLACASSDGSVSVVEHQQDGSWSSSKIPNAHVIGVTAVSWAPAVPAGSMVSSQPPSAPVKRLCTAGCDNTVKVWRANDMGGWDEEQTLHGHRDWVRDAAWAPNLGMPLSTIASAGQDGQVIAWTEQQDGTWQMKLVHNFGAPVWKLSWSVAGNILAVSDANNAVSLWKETLDGVWQQVVQ